MTDGSGDTKASGRAPAVFISYASQDAEAARRICDALHAEGIEVWFDQSELRGGDAWDQSIRKQIKTCALFLPIISRNTHDRVEGYFRLEWKLAVDRSHLIAADQAFLLPVVIDDTRDDDERVPERFREVQWTRLPGGDTPPAFVSRIKRLLSPELSQEPTGTAPAAARVAAAPTTRKRGPAFWRSKPALLATIAVVVVALGYLVANRLVLSKHGAEVGAVPGSAAQSIPATAFNPPSHSIAVLPLTNESGDASQQYFSDGLSEDLITALSQFPGLKVIGRHSSFQFRDSKDDSKTIGAKLGVTHLLEGSVRRAGDLVRVSAELIDTSDGSTQWSERYDRPYKDLFALQDDVTRAVAGALKAHLLRGVNVSLQSDRPPSGKLEAYNAMLEGKYYLARDTEADTRKAIERFSLATQLDTRYGLAWSLLARAWTYLGGAYLDAAPAKEAYANARAAADTALTLAPTLASAHLARGRVLQVADFDWRGAEAEFRRASGLAAGDADPKFFLGSVLATLGQVDTAIELYQEALATDPLAAGWYVNLGGYFAALNRLDEAEGAIRKGIALQPGGEGYHAGLALIAILRGNAEAALAAARQEPQRFERDVAVAAARQIEGNRAAADAALKDLINQYGNFSPYWVAWIYALRKDTDKTFEWLDHAWSERDGSIAGLLYDPVILRYRNDPRFAAFCRKVGLPLPGEAAARKSA